MALHGFDGVLEDIDTRSILQTCRYIDERQGVRGEGVCDVFRGSASAAVAGRHDFSTPVR
jgi:hypothetical protein